MANSNGWGDGAANNNIGWGQGAINNSISWGKSHINSWSGATDIDGGNAPTNTVAPAITGTAQEGQTLTCSTGTWTGTPTYTYQWKRNGSNIGSATNSTYTLVTADVGQSILCTVTATNGVGSANADSNTVTPTSSVDPDAQAFITAASITNPTQQSAINTLVTDLKGYNIWTKMKALYPMIGGTSTSTSYNLKNTAQFQISWSGGVTWGANGVQFGGVNGYGNTGLNQLSVLTQNSQHISFYSRTNTDGNFGEIGLKSSGTAYTLIQTKYSNNFVSAVNESYNFADNSANANGQGFYVGNRTGATLRNNWKNGSKVHTSSSASQTQANFNFFVGALNNAGTASGYSNRQCAFASIGDGLSDTEAANFYTAVQAFQTTLGRQV